jgi:hypothetical protein
MHSWLGHICAQPSMGMAQAAARIMGIPAHLLRAVWTAENKMRNGFMYLVLSKYAFRYS